MGRPKGKTFTTNMSISLPQEQGETLRAMARERLIPASQIVREAVSAFLSKTIRKR